MTGTPPRHRRGEPVCTEPAEWGSLVEGFPDVSIVESLKRLFDPATAQQEDAERRADRERPQRENEGGPARWFECRVCHYVGQEPTFCPTCLAGTMKPTRARAPTPEPERKESAAAPDRSPAQQAAADEDAEDEDASPDHQDDPTTALPIGAELDLHTFAPRDLRALLPEYLGACQENGLLEVRVVHGKGTGALRRSVHALLSRDPRVASFRLASEDAGGWGATLVTLHPAPPTTK
jgi:DNA-nicking Smr family endonuclease